MACVIPPVAGLRYGQIVESLPRVSTFHTASTEVSVPAAGRASPEMRREESGLHLTKETGWGA